MKSNTISKINKLGKAGYIICKIGKIALSIAAIACLVGAVIMCFVPRNAVKLELSTTSKAVIHIDENIDLSKIVDLDIDDGVLELGQNSFQVIADKAGEPVTMEKVFFLSDIKWILFAAAVACCAAYVPFYFGCKLCHSFNKCETPFTEEISKGLTNLAWSLIPLYAVGSLMVALANSILSGVFDFSFRFDITSILLILFVFMLSLIFKHGTALQAESDETL